MKRHILITIEVGNAAPDVCGDCPFATISYSDGADVCTNPAFEVDGQCPDRPGGKRLAVCAAAEIAASE